MLNKKKLFQLAKGFRGRAKNCVRISRPKVEKALQYATRDRRAKKREFRQLWVTRINAAAREHGLKYSVFLAGLAEQNIKLDRKVLSEIAIYEPHSFKALVDQVKFMKGVSMLSPRDSCALSFQTLPEDLQLYIMSKVDFTSRRTSVPLVCRAWRDLMTSATIWSDALDVVFPVRPAINDTPAASYYATFAVSVTNWLARVHAAPTAVCVTHAANRPDREGAALLLLLRCLNWNVTRLSLEHFSAVTVGTALRVLGKQQRLIGLQHVTMGTLDMKHEHRVTEALACYSANTLRTLELDICGIIDNHELLCGLSALTQLTRLQVTHRGGSQADGNGSVSALDQGIVTADVSPWLKSLRALQTLCFVGVPLPCVPAMAEMPALAHVRVVDSGITCWEDGVYPSSLQSLDLSNSLITCVPESMVSLTALHLHNAQLQQHEIMLFGDDALLQRPRFPSQGLPALRVLDVSYVGQVHGLSEAMLRGIAACRQLQQLVMRGCRIATLPVWFGQQLQQVRVLDVSETEELQVLPTEALQAMGGLEMVIARDCVRLRGVETVEGMGARVVQVVM